VFLAADLVVVGLRALTFVAVFFAVGTWMFLALWERDLEPQRSERIRGVARGASVAALALTVVHYVLTPARMAGDFGSTFDPSLQALLLQSSSGPSSIARLVGLALLTMSLDRATRLNAVGAAIGAALAIGSFALGGHAAIHPLRFVLGPLLLVHLAAATFWFGALWPLAAIAGAGPHEHGGALLAHFSRLAARVVPLVLLCGVGMTVIFVRSVSELVTPYGALVVAKTVGFGVALLVGEVNRRRYLPGISRGEERAERGYRRAAAVEWTALVAVLVATAVMTSLYAPEHLEGAFGAGHGVAPEH
jgi:copper resistance protein D